MRKLERVRGHHENKCMRMIYMKNLLKKKKGKRERDENSEF